VAFSQTDFTEDLKSITIPVLVMHVDDDQIVPSRRRTAIGQAAAQRHLEDLLRVPTRHASRPSAIATCGRGRAVEAAWRRDETSPLNPGDVVATVGFLGRGFAEAWAS
jgi:predicted alpha/beta hydrolase